MKCYFMDATKRALLNVAFLCVFFFPTTLLLFICSTEVHKNVISPLEGDTKDRVLHEKHTDLKQKMRDLNQGFERLQKLSHEGFTEDSGEGERTLAHTYTSSLFLYLFNLFNHCDL